MKTLIVKDGLVENQDADVTRAGEETGKNAKVCEPHYKINKKICDPGKTKPDPPGNPPRLISLHCPPEEDLGP